MTTNELFPLIEPPPGGLAQLRARLNHEQKRTRRPILLLALGAGSGCVAVAAAILIFLSRPVTFERLIQESDDLVLVQYGFKPIPENRAHEN